MLDRLDSYDWKGVFDVANEKVKSVGGDEGTGLPKVRREDVAEIVAMSNGELAGEEWLGIFRLKDGQYAFISAWAEISWIIWAHGSVLLSNDIESLKRSISADDLKRLGIG